MLRATCALRAVSAYTIFLIRNKANPNLKGLSIAKRGKLLGKLFRDLSSADLAVLRKVAAVTPVFKGASKPARKPNAYAKFYAKVYPTLTGKATSRMKQIANLWKKQKVSKK